MKIGSEILSGESIQATMGTYTEKLLLSAATRKLGVVKGQNKKRICTLLDFFIKSD
jgi:hypothetical protein